MKKKILVLGKTGMLGHMVFDYFSSLGKYNVLGTNREDFDILKMSDWEIEEKIKAYSPDYIINCIGLINVYANENEELAKKINSTFPHLLAYLGIKNNWEIIHISTDCYLDEDIYGRSKFFGEINDKYNITIRTSIIGPELKDGFGLFHWFMKQKEEVNGFVGAFWDGVTTLQLSIFIGECIDKGNLSGIIDYRTKESSNKHELLRLISIIFNKNTGIRMDNREMKDKRNPNADIWCLKDYPNQLKELRDWMINHRDLYGQYLG